MFRGARTLIVVVVALAALASVAAGRTAADPAPFRITPDRVSVGTFFRGTTIHVSGDLEAGSGVVVVVTAGQTVEETYNRKGRIGPFWASVGKVTVGELPALHLVAASAPVSTLLARTEIDAHLLDLEALGQRAALAPAREDRNAVVGEYLKLKQQQGVVGVFEGAVQVRGSAAATAFDAAIPWPASAPAGTYRVIVRHVRDQQVVAEQAQTLEVAYVGLPRLIAFLAFERSLAYGIMAVVIALGVGFVMGLLFKRGTAGH